MPWHNYFLSRQYYALNAIWILDTSYTRSVKCKLRNCQLNWVSDDWKLVYCKIHFKNIFSIYVLFPLFEKCLCTDSIKPSMQFSYNFVVINASEGSLCFQIFKRILYRNQTWRYRAHIKEIKILSTLYLKWSVLNDWILLLVREN
jgi:hypothetical protein